MTSELERSIGEFLAATEQTPGLWGSVDVRVLAARFDGDWHNLLTRCYLDPRPPKSVVRFPTLPATENVACWQRVYPVDAVRKLLEGVSVGEVSLEDLSIKYWSVAATGGRQPYTFSTYLLSDISEPYHKSYGAWSCHELAASGNSLHEVERRVAGGRRALENAIRTSQAPFDGLEGVARFAVASSDPLQSSRVCLFEIFAPLQGLIAAARCHFEKGALHYAVTAGSEQAAEQMKLGVFAVGPGPIPFTQSFDLPSVGWKRAGHLWEFEADLELQEYQVATLLLAVGPFAVHRLRLIDPAAGGRNPRLEAYRAFDIDLAALRDSLDTEGSTGAAQFDPAVARLLGLVGFQVTRLSGDKRLEEAVDLIAHTPAGAVCLAVECTTGALSSQGKLGKLVARVEPIRRAVPQLDVRGVLITCLERSRVAQADLDAAAADDLIVLCQEDLDDLVALAVRSAPLTEVLAYLHARIPPKPRE